MSYRRCDLVRTVQPGQHDTGRALVKHAAEPNPLRRLDPDHGRHPVRAGRDDDRTDLLLAAGAVLEVEQYPVDAGCGTHFRRDRRGRSHKACQRWACPQRGCCVACRDSKET